MRAAPPLAPVRLAHRVSDENGVGGLGYCHAVAAITTHGEGAEAALRSLTKRGGVRTFVTAARILEAAQIATRMGAASARR
jgi:hypothetical protein